MKHRTDQRTSRRGFSLVELVLACALLAILLAAGRGAIGLANKAARSDSVDRSVSLSAALNEISGDVACATLILDVGSNAIGVIVPDRNGDGEEETLEYSWSGTAGDPLLRSLNSGSAEIVVASVHSFAVESAQQTISVPAVSTKVTERLVGGNSTSSSLKTATISSSNSRAGSFVPANLGTGATSWNLTRVRVMVRQNSPIMGSFAIQVQGTNSQAPSGVVLGEASIAEADISSSYGWKEVSFSNITNLSTVSPIAIVVKRLSPAIEPCDLQATGSGSAMVAGNAYFGSSNGGASWSLISGEDMIYSVYGIPNAPTPTTTATGLRSLRITAESAAGNFMHVNIPLVNIPQLQ
jgi:prepilin-type N-terminal cleavage/methylation domain-containing protein